MNGYSKKIKSYFLVFFPLAFFVAPVLHANPQNLQILGVTNTNPSPGTSISVTVTFCDDTPYASNSVFLMAGFVAGTVSGFNACASPNQYMVMDSSISGNFASGPGMYDTGNSPQGVSGASIYPAYTNGATPSCPSGSVTAVWPIYIDGTYLTLGTYSLVVAASEYYVTCQTGSGGFTTTSTTIYVPPPPPTPTPTPPPPSFTINKRVEAATAAPNGLVLFDVDYNFVNSGPTNITDPIPADVTFVSASSGGSVSSGSVSWDFGNVSGSLTGTAWFLGRINSGTPDSTSIINVASANALSTSNPSNPVTTVVHIPQLTLTKSETAASLAAGQNITYNLDWTAAGQNLQIFDSYDNIAANSNTTGGPVPWGYDGTNYTVVVGPGPGNSLGSWTVKSDPLNDNNNYIEATVPYNSSGSGGNYPEMLRSVPGADICDTIIVEGDLEIPNSAPGASSGADAHMVIACNPSQGITLKAAISLDNSPGNLFVQKNNIYPLQSASAATIFSSPFTVSKGQWYTMMSTIHSTGTGTTTFNIVLWPRGTPADAVTLNYTDTFAPQPVCSGGWVAGWQADETAGTNWYSNLKVFGPGPVVNAAVTDIIPAGVSYLGSSVNPSATSPLVWDVAGGAFPATMFSFDNPIKWWGTVACTGSPISNSFTMAADSIPAVTSNTVNLTVSSCTSVTPTNTPTNSPTLTPTNSPTMTPTPTATNSPTPPINTFTPTSTNTPTITFTPTITPTFTATPIGLHVWPNPFNPRYANGGLFKAYQVPSGSSMDIYTVSGEWVNSVREARGLIGWNGTNHFGVMVSTGTYYYVIKSQDTVLLKGKVLVLMD